VQEDQAARAGTYRGQRASKSSSGHQYSDCQPAPCTSSWPRSARRPRRAAPCRPRPRLPARAG